VERRSDYGRAKDYRERAAEMFRLANAAGNSRRSYLSLADTWEYLARQVEQPPEMAMTERNALAVAREMIKAYGPDAEDRMQRISEQSEREGDGDEAAFWRRVAQAVRMLQAGPS
jgi:hypothetical protein